MALRCLSGVIALVLLGVVADSVHGKCDVGGIWQSEHGTLLTMELGVNRSIDGTYQSSEGAPKSHLLGYQQAGDSPTFGVAVKNMADPSITVITGQCFTDSYGETKLWTTWIRRGTVPTSKDEWKASLFGSVSFSKYVAKKGTAA
ncbi:avidin-related protein 1-like [Lissotriton helveticus]